MRKSFSRFSISIPYWFILLSILDASVASDVDLPKLARETRPAVVLILVYGRSDDLIRTGTGFFISADGKLVTSLHVIEGADHVVAKFENEKIVAVPLLIASDQKLDIAVLQAKVNDQPFLILGDSRLTEVGERVAVIGSPLGLDGTLSEGIISAKRDNGQERKWLQITAPVSPGSSGSPVLNGKGEVIGVATMVVSGGQALNFAVPIDSSQSNASSKSTQESLKSELNVQRSAALSPEVVKELESQDYRGRPLSAEELSKRDSALGRAVRDELETGQGPSPAYKAYLMGFWRKPPVDHR